MRTQNIGRERRFEQGRIALLATFWISGALCAPHAASARPAPQEPYRIPGHTVQPMPQEKTPDRSIKLEQKINDWRGSRVLKMWRGDTKRKEVALTFDDGPHPAVTQRLLDLLHQLNVRATFFVVGKKVDEAPEMVQRIVHEGHEVANHTYHHLNLDNAPESLVLTEIHLGNDAIRRACGLEPTCFRPPGGHHNENVLRGAEKMGMRTILWTDDPADFANPGADVLEARLLNHIHNGAVILLHDGIEQTMEILPDVIARLRHEGYHFVTASEMIQHLEASGRGHQ